MNKKLSATEKKAFRKLQEIYVKQQNEEVTEENIREFGLDLGSMKLITETENSYIVLYNEGMSGGFLDIISKKEMKMDVLELSIDL